MIESADGVIIAVALGLVVMSVLSWAAIGARLLYGWQRLRQRPAAPEAFWAEADRERATQLIAESDRSGLLLRLAHRAQSAASTVGGSLSDRMVRQLRDELLLIRNDLSSGLGLLASIGSTAPLRRITRHGLVNLSCPHQHPRPGAGDDRSGRRPRWRGLGDDSSRPFRGNTGGAGFQRLSAAQPETYGQH